MKSNLLVFFSFLLDCNCKHQTLGFIMHLHQTLSAFRHLDLPVPCQLIAAKQKTHRRVSSSELRTLCSVRSSELFLQPAHWSGWRPSASCVCNVLRPSAMSTSQKTEKKIKKAYRDRLSFLHLNYHGLLYKLLLYKRYNSAPICA